MKKVKNKIAVVTGGGSGIGAALCEELAASGARAVHVIDINSDAASRVASSLATIATHSTFQYGFDVADVGNECSIKKVIKAAWSRYGRIDIYFSNAGIFALGGIAEDEYANEEWEKIWRINVMSHIYAARSLFPLWKSNNYREGIFVVTASAGELIERCFSRCCHVINFFFITRSFSKLGCLLKLGVYHITLQNILLYRLVSLMYGAIYLLN